MKKGATMSQEHKEKISKANKAKPAPNRNYWLGKKRSPEDVEKFRLAKLGTHRSVETRKKISETRKRLGLKPPHVSGKNHQNWKGGISKNHHSTSEPKYKEWRMKVFERDMFKCKIFNQDCKGQLQAHHILKWAEYPELRYEINNGITLCIAHHPRKWAEEKRLAPEFQRLIGVSKELE